MKKHLFLTSLAAILATTAAGAVEIEDVVANAKLTAASAPESAPLYSAYQYDSDGDGVVDTALVDGNESIDSNADAFTYQNRSGDWGQLTLDTATGTAQAATEINPEDYFYTSPTTGHKYIGSDKDINESLYTYNAFDKDGGDIPTNLKETPEIKQTNYTYASTKAFTGEEEWDVSHEPVYSDYKFVDATLAGTTLENYVTLDNEQNPVIDAESIEGLDSAAQASIANALAAYITDHDEYKKVFKFYDDSVKALGEAEEAAGKDSAVVKGMNGVYTADKSDYDAKYEAYTTAQESLASAKDSYGDAKTAFDTADSAATAYANSLSKVIDDKLTSANTLSATDVEKAVNYGAGSVKEAIASIDANMGTIHGLIESKDAKTTTTGAKYYGNLAVGTTVEDHLEALDSSIGDLRELDGDHVDSSKNVALNLQSLNDGIEAETERAQKAELKLQEQINASFAMADTQILSKANAYTDAKVNKLEKDMSGGVAAATALSAVSVGNVERGEVSVGGGYGYYNGESAMAFGAAMGLSDRWSINAGAGLASGDSTQFSIRAGTNYKFKLF